jgi:hypothetical protein
LKSFLVSLSIFVRIRIRINFDLRTRKEYQFFKTPYSDLIGRDIICLPVGWYLVGGFFCPKNQTSLLNLFHPQAAQFMLISVGTRNANILALRFLRQDRMEAEEQRNVAGTLMKIKRFWFHDQKRLMFDRIWQSAMIIFPPK